MRQFSLIALAFATAFTVVAAPGQAAPVAAGQVWALDDARGPVLKFNDCGGKLCAALVALGPDTVAPQDIHNPDVALRKRPLCGLNIITGLTRTSAGLVGGTLYDPQTGASHTIKLDDRGSQAKVLVPFGPFTGTLKLLVPAGVAGKCAG